MSFPLLLDTVVISEFRKGMKADPSVLAWQATATGVPAYVSVITLLEIRLELREIRHRDPVFAVRLETWYRDRLLPGFRSHILPVSQAITETAAALGSGRTLPRYDALIAATAHVHGLTLVTRNLADFEDLGILLVNPWSQP